MAWGIVPTLKAEDIDGATDASLTNRFKEYVQQLTRLGCKEEIIYNQSLITPSCGVGPLSPASAIKVLELTRDVSQNVRKEIGR